jgi:hypothetical protein
MTVNLFLAAGYLAFSEIGGFGDWRCSLISWRATDSGASSGQNGYRRIRILREEFWCVTGVLNPQGWILVARHRRSAALPASSE